MNMIDMDSVEYSKAETVDGKRVRIPIAYSYSIIAVSNDWQPPEDT